MKIDRIGSQRFKGFNELKLGKIIKLSIICGTIAITMACTHINKITNNATPSVVTSIPTITVTNNVQTPTPTIEKTVTPTIEPTPIIAEELITATPAATIVPTPTPKKKATKFIALTFDDGPDPVKTLQILKILEENDSHATFFVLGSKVRKYADVLKKVYNAGNEIGSHSFTHERLTLLSKKEVTYQFNSAEKAIYSVLKIYPPLFRPPYGSNNDTVRSVINSPIICWTIDSNDYQDISVDQVVKNVMSKLGEGKIILMHDIQGKTVKACLIMIPKIKALGYEIVSVSELFEHYKVKLKDHNVYRSTKKKMIYIIF